MRPVRSCRQTLPLLRRPLFHPPPPALIFVIEDDGVGLSGTGQTGFGMHFGMNIMRERAERIGAQVHVASSPGEGTAVLLELAQ